MTKKIVLPGHISRRKDLWMESPNGRDRFDALRVEIDGLLPDEAVFVVEVWPEPATDGRVRQLRRVLRHQVQGKHLVMIDDLNRGGVWIYRVQGERPLVGRTVGPVKAEEILRRPLD